MVVVSVPPQAFFVERMAGELVNVAVMIPPGANPVTYEPTMRQLTVLTRATWYVKVGHPNFAFERAWLEKLLADSPGVQVVNASAGVRRQAGDPHVWVSPACACIMVTNTAAALIERMPAHTAGFTEPAWVQTLSKTLGETREIESGRAGYGQGALVVVKANRP